MTGKYGKNPSWVRWSGIGFELVGAVAGLTLVGYWIDHRYGCQPWGVLIGAGLGLVGGMYNLIRQSLAAVKEAEHGSTTGGKKSS
jgi:F0F1-type ATP synthase assembly protein I